MYGCKTREEEDYEKTQDYETEKESMVEIAFGTVLLGDGDPELRVVAG